jgi:ABC-type transport system involved in multi-copper enzyme maturation permease subunit
MATTTVVPGQRLSSLPPATGRAGLAGAIRSEFTKLRSVRSTYWTLIALIVVSIGLGALISGSAAAHLNSHPLDKAGFDPTKVSLFAFFELGQLVIVVLGAMAITAEYSTGMIRTSLTAQPRRGTVYAAKALVFAAVAAVVSFVTAFVAFFLGQALLSSAHVNATLSQPRVLQAIVGSALVVLLVALVAFGLGAIIRHTAGAIFAGIALFFVVPIIAQILPSDWRHNIIHWLPSSAGDALTTTVGSVDQNLFAPWTQFAVTAAYAAVLLAVGAYLFRKRDA